jgi:hypothetical protein
MVLFDGANVMAFIGFTTTDPRSKQLHRLSKLMPLLSISNPSQDQHS